MNHEVSVKIAVLRQKASAGTATREDLREAIELMRQSRGQAAKVATAKKAAKGPINTEDLLSELGDLPG